MKDTPLISYHKAHNAKLVSFAGFNMPLYYLDQGILSEHFHTREYASIFDVSHMAQIKINVQNAFEEFNYIFPAELSELKINHLKYSFFPNEQGGIVDDLIITRLSESEFFIVSNASRIAEDLAHLHKYCPNVSLDYVENSPMIALQGSKSEEILLSLGADVANLTFMQGGYFSIENVNCWISRTGYTGEDGFEIIIPNSGLNQVMDSILANENIHFAGLAARDSLRLEAGLCLYGNDLNETTSPIEAGLSWVISKSKKQNKNFLGADKIVPQIGNTQYKLVGLKIDNKLAGRQGAEVVKDGKNIGKVSSGGYSPTLDNTPIAMALVDKNYSAIGNEVAVLVRNKELKATVVKLPFVPHQYKK